jgi:hypothetical protein
MRTAALLLAAAVPMAQCFTASPALGLRTSTPGLRCPSARVGAPTVAAPRSAARASDLRMQGGAWGSEDEKPAATKELMQIRFASVDAAKFKAWIQQWPFATAKAGYGLPKLMLPVDKNTNEGGVKLVFKGTEDPWVQIDLEGDTVRVYRQSKMSTSMLQVSALKEREEKKICDKLKEDLEKFGAEAGATGLNEKEIPVIEVKKEEPAAESEEGAAEEPAAGEEPKAEEPKDEGTPPAVA